MIPTLQDINDAHLQDYLAGAITLDALRTFWTITYPWEITATDELRAIPESEYRVRILATVHWILVAPGTPPPTFI